MVGRSDLLRCLAALFATLAVSSLSAGAAVSTSGSVAAGAAIGPFLALAAPVA